MNARRKFIKVVAALTVLTAALPFTLKADEELPVVATFSILGDMVKRIGGNAVSVSTLVGRNGDTHVYQPTPADAKTVKRAAVLFTNGLEFEGWLDRLAEAAEFSGDLIVTTIGVKTISLEHDDGVEGHHDEHHHGEIDPHAWQSLENAVVYVDNIAAALAKAAPAHAATFYVNRTAYVAEIKSLDAEIRDMIASLPDAKRTIVTSHDAFQYFGRDYELTFIAPQGMSTESEASAQDVANLIEQIRAQSISAVFIENVADPRLVSQIANETGTVVGGKLFPGALSDGTGPAATYLELIRHNARTISTALTAASSM